MHDLNAIELNGYQVSVGMIRMTRIAHTAALAVQMRSGDLGDRLRLLVCLHAQMPRLHRAYIETRLKRALTRKGAAPDKGVLSLCHAEDVFSRADEVGKRKIEIVVVTTPVIETGNDVDFDWAILDPISTRSIIQSAGRVRRHRAATGDKPNIFILGCSPIAMQQGKLAMPGVETIPAEQTKVDRIELRNYEGRHFADLAGDADFTTITAAPLLSNGVDFPLRDAEAYLRKKMISTDERDPLGRYISRPNTRWNLTMTKTRKFRRSETREILFCKIGDSLDEAQWWRDLAPGTRSSQFRSVQDDLHTDFPVRACKLFVDMTRRGWLELSGCVSEMNRSDIHDLLWVSIPSYGDGLVDEMTYSEFTGFTRGKPEDLLEDFGKTL